MRSRRIACLVLGLWLGAGLWMQWVALENLDSADNLLLRPSPAAAAYLKTLGHAPLGPLAHYLAAEQNRSLWATWGVVQIAVSAAFFFLLLFGTRMGKLPLALALLLFLTVFGERLLITPEMAMVGRSSDFGADPSHRIRLISQALGYVYFAGELAKWMLAAGIAGCLIWQRGRSLDSRHEVDVVNKADYRHVDR